MTPKSTRKWPIPAILSVTGRFDCRFKTLPHEPGRIRAILARWSQPFDRRLPKGLPPCLRPILTKSRTSLKANILSWDIRYGDTTVPHMSSHRLTKSLYSGTYQRFLTLLRQRRLEAGLTQLDTAKRLGKPQSFISKCESGERRVDVAELLAFCRVYNTDPAEFICELEWASRRRSRKR